MYTEIDGIGDSSMGFKHQPWHGIGQAFSDVAERFATVLDRELLRAKYYGEFPSRAEFISFCTECEKFLEDLRSEAEFAFRDFEEEIQNLRELGQGDLPEFTYNVKATNTFGDGDDE